jgi:hypothetical protein
MASEKDDCLFSFLPEITQGELAHLARALAWHARGDRFDSGILHQKNESHLIIRVRFFFTIENLK